MWPPRRTWSLITTVVSAEERRGTDCVCSWAVQLLFPGDGAQPLTWFNRRLTWVRWYEVSNALGQWRALAWSTYKQMNSYMIFFSSQNGISNEKVKAGALWINIRDNNKIFKASVDIQVLFCFPSLLYRIYKGQPLLLYCCVKVRKLKRCLKTHNQNTSLYPWNPVLYFKIRSSASRFRLSPVAIPARM